MQSDAGGAETHLFFLSPLPKYLKWLKSVTLICFASAITWRSENPPAAARVLKSPHFLLALQRHMAYFPAVPAGLKVFLYDSPTVSQRESTVIQLSAPLLAYLWCAHHFKSAHQVLSITIPHNQAANTTQLEGTAAASLVLLLATKAFCLHPFSSAGFHAWKFMHIIIYHPVVEHNIFWSLCRLNEHFIFMATNSAHLQIQYI